MCLPACLLGAAMPSKLGQGKQLATGVDLGGTLADI